MGVAYARCVFIGYRLSENIIENSVWLRIWKFADYVISLSFGRSLQETMVRAGD